MLYFNNGYIKPKYSRIAAQVLEVLWYFNYEHNHFTSFLTFTLPLAINSFGRSQYSLALINKFISQVHKVLKLQDSLAFHGKKSETP